MSDTHGTICWSELATRDVAAAKRFYTKIAGWSWEVAEISEGTYHVASVGGKPVAGLFDMSVDAALNDRPPQWETYIAVDDVDKAVAQAVKAGGAICRPCWDIEGVGRIAVVVDPSGAMVNLMTPA